LHIAAKEGQEEVASYLLENKASVTATTKVKQFIYFSNLYLF